MSYAQDILDGLICGQCLVPFEEENGYHCLCRECWKEENPRLPMEVGVFDDAGRQLAAYDLVKPIQKGKK